MTTRQARRIAWRWFGAFAAACMVRIALDVAGIEGFEMSLGILEAVPFVLGWRYLGWVDGYVAGQQASEQKAHD